jgi:hypothetical protein
MTSRQNEQIFQATISNQVGVDLVANFWPLDVKQAAQVSKLGILETGENLIHRHHIGSILRGVGKPDNPVLADHE